MNTRSTSTSMSMSTSESPVGEHSMTRAPCAVCLQQMPLCKDGTIRVHGPVSRHRGHSGGSPSTIAPETREAQDLRPPQLLPALSCKSLEETSVRFTRPHREEVGISQMSESDVVRAILSFPKGSAGGPDGLRPHHLQDMTSTSAGSGGLHQLGAHGSHP